VFSLKWKIHLDVNPLSFYKITNSHPEKFLAQIKSEYLASCSTFPHLGVAMWTEYVVACMRGRRRLLKMGGQKKIKSYLGILTNIII